MECVCAVLGSPSSHTRLCCQHPRPGASPGKAAVNCEEVDAYLSRCCNMRHARRAGLRLCSPVIPNGYVSGAVLTDALLPAHSLTQAHAREPDHAAVHVLDVLLGGESLLRMPEIRHAEGVAVSYGAVLAQQSLRSHAKSLEGLAASRGTLQSTVEGVIAELPRQCVGCAYAEL